MRYRGLRLSGKRRLPTFHRSIKATPPYQNQATYWHTSTISCGAVAGHICHAMNVRSQNGLHCERSIRGPIAAGGLLWPEGYLAVAFLPRPGRRIQSPTRNSRRHAMVNSHHRRAHGPRRNSRSGAVATEMALLVPLISILLGGLVDWGCVFFVRHHMLQATREGTRILSLTGTDGVMAIDRSKDYLSDYYAGMVSRGVFRFRTHETGGTSETTSAPDEVWLEIRCKYADASLLGGWCMPAQQDMVTRLYMRRD